MHSKDYIPYHRRLDPDAQELAAIEQAELEHEKALEQERIQKALAYADRDLLRSLHTRDARNRRQLEAQ